MLNMLLSISSVFTSILYIALAIVVLLFMILIHEFGHYTAGKLLKFKINEFSVGFGKAIFKKTKKNGEVFSLRIFPLGGYCAFEGEDEDKQNVAGAFNNQKPWKRLIVLFMGAFFNFLSALIFAAILLMSFGYSDRVQVANVITPQSVIEADADWLKKGDIIHAVNGKETNFINDEYFITLVEPFKAEEDFVVSVYRDGKNVDITIHKSWFEIDNKQNDVYGKVYTINNEEYFIKKADGKDADGNDVYKLHNVKYPNGQTTTFNSETGLINLTFNINGSNVTETFKLEFDAEDNPILTSAKIGVATKNYVYGFFEALGKTFEFCFGWAWKILKALFQLITGQTALADMGGTITTVKFMATATQTNIANLLLLIPVISINLAVFNLLPIPALDGARMVFVLIEWIRKKPIDRKLEGKIHFIGLLVLFAFVIIMDILQLFVFKRF